MSFQLIVFTCLYTSVRNVNSQTCGESYFFDYGTGLCEPCRDICQHSKITRTEDQCRALCPVYAQTLANGQDQLQSTPSGTGTKNASAVTIRKNHFPLAIVSVVIAVFVFLFVVLLVVIIFKRNAILEWINKKRWHSSAGRIRHCQETHEGRSGNEQIALPERPLVVVLEE